VVFDMISRDACSVRGDVGVLGGGDAGIAAWNVYALKLRDRGSLATGNFADVVVFDPAKVKDLATYDKPHQLAVGMRDVFVNSQQVLANGEHTGALPGQVVRGPGYRR
jgi:N-acyl-D-amino-acid deacylase